MLSRHANAFTDASAAGDEDREVRLEKALRLLDEQAELLMRADEPSETPTAAAGVTEATHVPYNPHRRPLSSAARRLIRAHQRLEEAAQD